jgi:membrane-anchored protein YejM (alkaline phosphatase superfamily)
MSGDIALYLYRFLVVAVPVVALVGLAVAAWSAARTRRRYYEEFMRRRRSRRD